MAQLLPIALAIPFALLCGGRLGRISSLKLCGLSLFFLAACWSRPRSIGGSWGRRWSRSEWR
jgi:hypothetical protein